MMREIYAQTRIWRCSDFHIYESRYALDTQKSWSFILNERLTSRQLHALKAEVNETKEKFLNTSRKNILVQDIAKSNQISWWETETSC